MGIAKLPDKWLNSMVFGRYNEHSYWGLSWYINQLITMGPHLVFAILMGNRWKIICKWGSNFIWDRTNQQSNLTGK
jgi:hypothetical protein